MLIKSFIFFWVVLFFSSRNRHTRCALVTGVQTCALPILAREVNGPTRINREPNTLARIVAGGYPHRMSQVTAHKDAERADNVGFWVGVGAMTLIGGALYVAHRVLMHRFGDRQRGR